MILSMIFLAVSLSMDSFGIGMSYGIRNIKMKWSAKLTMCLISIIFTSISVILGNALASMMPEYLSRIIGSVMLILFGLFIIFQSLYKKKKAKRNDIKKNKKNIVKKTLDSLGFSLKIISDPICGDIDKSKSIDCIEAIYLGVALSIDSFGAGISCVTSGINSIFIPLVTAICQFLFISFGWFFGKKLRMFKNIDSHIFVVISGVLLILIAVMRLMFA